MLTLDMQQAIKVLNAMEVDLPPPTLCFRVSFIHRINMSAPSEHKLDVSASLNLTPPVSVAPQVSQVSGQYLDPSKETSQTASVPLASVNTSPPRSAEDVIEELVCIHDIVLRYIA
jgi:hypothetical protein